MVLWLYAGRVASLAPISTFPTLVQETLAQPNALYYSFDERSGRTVFDKSGNNRHGKIFGAKRINGKNGQALSFDGKNDYIDAGTFDPATKNMTIAVWINWRGPNSKHQVVVAKRDSFNQKDMRWQLIRDKRRGILFQSANRTAKFDQDIPFKRKWFHMAVTKEAGKITLYINGKRASTSSMFFGSDRKARVLVGNSEVGGNDPFYGAMDELRIYSRALSSQQIADLFFAETKASPRPAAHWFFDEGAGTTTSDISGFGRHGKIQGAQWVSGKTGSALAFDGLDDFVDVGTFDPSGQDLTLSLWINWAGPTGRNQKILAKRDDFTSKGIRWQLARNHEDSTLLFRSRSSVATFDVDIPSQNTWHHLAVTKEGSETTLYINGVGLSKGSMEFGPAVHAKVLLGNSAPVNDGAFHGAMDDVRIYDYALPPEEIEKLFSPTLSNSPPSVELDAVASVPLGAQLTLSPTVQDDGLPLRPGRVTILWRKSSGPGTVLFEDVESNPTTAVFSQPGRYVLNLNADDGALSTSANMLVTVQDPVPAPDVAHWKLDGAEADTVLDASGNGHSGSISGTRRVNGLDGKALLFDGGDDFVDFGTFDPSDKDMTLAVWVNWRGPNDKDQFMMAKRDRFAPQEMRWQLVRHRKQGILFQGPESTAQFDQDIPSEKQWHHLAVSKKDQVVTLYLNGNEVSSSTMFFGLGTKARVVMGNHEIKGGQAFNGILDDVRIYGKALGKLEIQALFLGRDPLENSCEVVVSKGASSLACSVFNSCIRPRLAAVTTRGSITWLNEDRVPHRLTSGTPSKGMKGVFDSGLIRPGDRFTYTFNEPGIFSYHSESFPRTRGSVEVFPIEKALDEFESDDTPEEATICNPNCFTIHNFHQPSDEDWVRFFSVRRFMEIGTFHQGANVDTAIDIFFQESDGSLSHVLTVDENRAGENQGETVSNEPDEGPFFIPPKQGFYFLRVRSGSESCAGPSDSFRLSLIFTTVNAIVAVASDILNQGTPPPGSQLLVDGGQCTINFSSCTSPFNSNSQEFFFDENTLGLHSFEVPAVPGYRALEHPSLPNQVNNPNNHDYGNPRDITIHSIHSTVFQFIPIVTATGTVRDEVSLQPLSGAEISFTALTRLVPGTTYDRYPNGRPYAAPWKSKADGSFPEKVFLIPADWDMTVAKAGYVTKTVSHAVSASAPGAVYDLGVVDLTPIPVLVDLEVGLSTEGTSLKEGQQNDFEAELQNHGPGDATDIEVLVSVPEGLTYDSHHGGAYDPVNGVWSISNLAPGSSLTLTIQATAEPMLACPKAIAYSAALQSLNESDSSSGNNSDEVLVTIVDGTSPSLSCPAAMAVIADQSGMGQTPAVVPEVVDNCSASEDIAVVQQPPQGVLLEVGTHLIQWSATDEAGNEDTCSSTLTVRSMVPVSVKNYQVSSSHDDAEEAISTGMVSLESSDLELAVDRGEAQMIGVRFGGVTLPQGANLVKAYLKFTSDEVGTEETQLLIQTELVDDAAPFKSSLRDLSDRTRSTEAIPWTPMGWEDVNESDARQTSPDLSPIVQEVIDQAAWAPGHALCFLITGTGRRTAESWDGDKNAAPVLHVEYGVSSHSGAFIAFNDFSWGPGQLQENITLYTTSAGPGSPPQGSSGMLIDYQTGSSVPIVMEVVGGSWNGNVHASLGGMPLAGTDGYEIFHDIVDIKGILNYGDSDIQLMLSGLSQELIYRVALLGNRDNSAYHDRLTQVTLLGAEGFRNVSTLGSHFAGPTDASVVIGNGANQKGLIADFVDIDPGIDKEISLLISDGGSEKPPKMYLSGLCIQGYQPTSYEEVEIFITSEEDDAEENVNTGQVSLHSSDLELIQDNTRQQRVGLRFSEVPVPQGAQIVEAALIFTVDEKSNAHANLSIHGEVSLDSGPFQKSPYNISSRSLSTSNVAWVPSEWNVVGASGIAQRTPNIAAVLQEIIDQPGWLSGNAVTIVLSGDGRRTAVSKDGDSGMAPRLQIKYLLSSMDAFVMSIR